MVIDFRQNQRQGYGDLPGASDFAHVLGTAHLKPFIIILTLAKEALENFERALGRIVPYTELTAATFCTVAVSIII